MLPVPRTDDVWLTEDGRVLAALAIPDGVSHCGPATFGWGRSCSTEWF